MAEERSDDAAEAPPVFRRISGWVAGLTGIVLALAGLRAAYHQLSPAAPVEQVANAPDANSTEAAVDDTATSPAEPAASLPLSYTGVDLSLQWKNGVWVETSADDVSRYEQLSRDEKSTHAVDRARGLYLRWPNKGGMVEKSATNDDPWSDYYSIEVTTDDAPSKVESSPAG